MTRSSPISTWANRQPFASMTMNMKSFKKLSVLLPAELHLRAKRQAVLKDQTLTDLIISLLLEYLESAEQEEA